MRRRVIFKLLTATFACVAGGASAASASSSPGDLFSQVYSVRVQGVYPSRIDDRTIFAATEARSSDAYIPKRWVAEQRIHITAFQGVIASGKTTFKEIVTEKHRWIDGNKCPALAKALTELGRLPAAHFTGDAPIPTAAVVFHAPEVSVEGPLQSPYTGQLSMRDQIGPISSWWRSSEASVETCWQPDPPVVEGAPVKSMLSATEEPLR